MVLLLNIIIIDWHSYRRMLEHRQIAP